MWELFINGWRHSAQVTEQSATALVHTAGWSDNTPCYACAPDSGSYDGAERFSSVLSSP
jgi:hypothetical protein